MSVGVDIRSRFEAVPMCLPTEQGELADHLLAVSSEKESLLVTEFTNYFSSTLQLRYLVSLVLCANAIAMWKTERPVTRLFLLSGDVAMQELGLLYAFANEFRSLMWGGFARLDNISTWLKDIGIAEGEEPPDLRDVRRAVRMFNAARVSPDEMPELLHATWFFGFRGRSPELKRLGHFSYEARGSHSASIVASDVALDIVYDTRVNSGSYEILANTTPSASSLRLDLTGIRAPMIGSEISRLLSVFAGVVSLP